MPHSVLCKIQMPRRRAAALPRSDMSETLHFIQTCREMSPMAQEDVQFV